MKTFNLSKMSDNSYSPFDEISLANSISKPLEENLHLESLLTNYMASDMSVVRNEVTVINNDYDEEFVKAEMEDEDSDDEEYEYLRQPDFWHSETFSDTRLEQQVAVATERYGGFNLKIHDSDSGKTYGGTNSVSNLGYVRQLQEDLRTLGFLISPDKLHGEFDVNTQVAVREFQIHAKMQCVALQSGITSPYSDTLVQVRNSSLYTGRVTGVVNYETRNLIETWLRLQWRCPIVIEAIEMSAGNNFKLDKLGNPIIIHQNLWRHDDLKDSKPRMFTKDLSNYYATGSKRDLTKRNVLGTFIFTSNKSKRIGGPESKAGAHCWPEAEILPETLFSHVDRLKPLISQMSNEQIATFKILRAVSEVECEGFYDGLNAWDNQYISVPIFHMTLGLPVLHPDQKKFKGESNPKDPGAELGGFLSYFQEFDSFEYDRLFGFAGIKAHEAWSKDGSNLLVSSRRYCSLIDIEEESFFRVLRPSEYYWFRSWHWFYRFAIAGRTSKIYHKALYNFARIRLRALLNTPWDNKLKIEFTASDGTKQQRLAELGDIFKSEKAIAILFRWHVKSPGHIAAKGKVAANIRNAITSISGVAWKSPLRITLVDEQKLIDELLKIPGKPDSMTMLVNWPSWSISKARNIRNYNLDKAFCSQLSMLRTFSLDETGI